MSLRNYTTEELRQELQEREYQKSFQEEIRERILGTDIEELRDLVVICMSVINFYIDKHERDFYEWLDGPALYQYKPSICWLLDLDENEV